MTGAVVLTGAPGTGKTSMIEALGALGETCFEEPARPILNEQLRIDGPALPSKDPHKFVEAMLRVMIRHFQQISSNRTFSDRGIPDLIAYARRFEVSDQLFRKAAAQYRYRRQVFILEPWQDIFVNDDLRKLSFEESQRFHTELLDAYGSSGYELISVPRLSIEDRVQFVYDSLKQD